MTTKQNPRVGNGKDAKIATKRWAKRQTLTHRAYGGPVRLLSLIIAVGVPLACYAFAEAQMGGWWPLAVGVATPVAVLGIRWLSERASTKRERAAHPHPLQISTSSN